jgi:hypothetical protein
VPIAVSGGILTISGIELRVYVLDDGQRIIDADDIDRLIAAWLRGAPPPTDKEAQAYRRWVGYERAPAAQERRNG